MTYSLNLWIELKIRLKLFNSNRIQDLKCSQNLISSIPLKI